MNKYDKRHNLNLAKYERQLKALFDAAASDAANLASLIGKLGETPFAWKDYPLALIQMERIIKQLNRDITVSIVNGIRSEWTLANSKNNELCNVVFGSLANSLPERAARRYYSTNEQARDAFIARKEQGLGLSDRVWRYTGQFKNEIELALDTGIRSGRSADELSRDVREYLQHPDKLFRRVRDEHGQLHLSKAAAAYHPGAGVYRSSYMNARRLTSTETNIAYRTSDYLRWQQMDFVVGIEIRMSNNHPIEDICDELAGRYPKDFKFTGWHPFCRCHVVPVLKTEEEMDKDTQRILDGEEPLPGSVNGVTGVPPAFTEWTTNNSERIEAAEARGTLPYFIKDNIKYVNPKWMSRKAVATVSKFPTKYVPSDVSSLNNKDSFGNIMSDEYIGQRIVDKGKDYIISKRFAGLKTHDEVASTLSEYLGKRLGHDVDIIASPEFIDLKTAKAYATEIERLSRQYQLRQGRLMSIRLGYHTPDPNEYGMVHYNPKESEKKTLYLNKAFDIKYSDKAIKSSRCDDKYLERATATHEFGHLLYQFRDIVPGQDILFESKVQEVYDNYRKEVNSLIRKRDMDKLAELYLGNYADTGIGEFLAEAFQEYKNCRHPSKYATEIGNLIDRWFKR